MRIFFLITIVILFSIKNSFSFFHNKEKEMIYLECINKDGFKIPVGISKNKFIWGSKFYESNNKIKIYTKEHMYFVDVEIDNNNEWKIELNTIDGSLENRSFKNKQNISLNFYECKKIEKEI